MSLLIECRAKINLYLGITGKRDDGYHEIETVYQPVSLSDTIRISEADSGIVLRGSDESIGWGSGNLCRRAAEAIFREAGYRGGARIEVDKKIPHGAGLGGGSSDAAGVLIGLNRLFDFRFSTERLAHIGLAIGSDVPFFVFNKPAIGRGRGEILEGIRGIEDVFILLIIPDMRINTADAYKNIDLVLTKVQSRYKLGLFLEGLSRIPHGRIRSHNSFEKSVSSGYPEVRNILNLLRKNGKALFSSLSGSGSVCFSVFAERREADQEFELMAGKGYSGIVVEPREKAIKL
ncbi:MAG: 4-(cytidine 5'-diphospho)-2-C-methyl-D-erythritol kinase [Candidatus Krumholzibacteriales bacterium]